LREAKKDHLARPFYLPNISVTSHHYHATCVDSWVSHVNVINELREGGKKMVVR